ncbi:MAG: hypothetical protein PHE25_01265 [Candidatus Gracilibacteria bacterium]|nr:hypothetical protein [Candidatus Gracilibacteria bacterium]
MKKIFFIMLFIFSINITNAGWYGNHGISYNNPGISTLPTVNGGGPNNGTLCDTDGDSNGGSDLTLGEYAVALNNDPNTLTPNSSFSVAIAPSGTIRCLYWDSAMPTISNDYTFNNIWANGTRTITLSPIDTGGSGISTTKWCEGSTCDPSVGNIGTSITKSGDYNNTIRYQTWDIAGNVSSIGSFVLKLDNSAPTITDMTTPIPDNLLANNLYNYSVNVSNGGYSPIKIIQGVREQSSNENIDISYSCISSPCNVSWDIKNIDNYINNGGRQYTFRVTKACDEVGNCWNGTKDFNHNVYADTQNITTKLVNTNLSDISNIADGTTKNLAITLKDTYGNNIIPASGIGRNITLKFDINNSMYLDQFNRTGNSSIFLTNANEDQSISSNFTNKFPIGNSINSLTNQSSTNGIYNYGFKVYTPTSNQNNGPISDLSAIFTINGITFDVNGSLGSILDQSIGSSSITTKFSPLYFTTITGDLRNEGFTTDGTIQNSNILINPSDGGNDVGVSSKKIYLKFGGETINIPNKTTTKYNLMYSKTGNPTIAISKTGLSTIFDDSSSSITTGLELINQPKPSSIKAYLSTHISYSLDGKNITYNSDIVGKTSYFATYTNEKINSKMKNVYQELIKNDFGFTVRNGDY